MTKKLKVLNLMGCTKLTRTPGFSNFMSLEILILAWCSKLITIDCSIGKLEVLKTLNIKGCSSLEELSEEVGSLRSLTQIVMPQNYKLLKLPERFGDLISLSSFILDEHPRIIQLPNSIGGLVKLTHLSLRGCVGIMKLPPSVGELQMLVELDVSKSGIWELPNSIGKLKKLRVLRIDYTHIEMFPHTIGGAEMLEELHAKKCWFMTEENMEEIGKLSHLRILDLSYTSVVRLPEVIGCLSRLEKLQLGSIKLQQATRLPSNVTCLKVRTSNFSFINLSNLINLDYLKLHRLTLSSSTRCYDLRKLEADWMRERPTLLLPSHLSALKLTGIRSLPHFSNLESLSLLHVAVSRISYLPVSQGLIHLMELKICRCEFLEEIPGLSLLKRLQRLVLNRLSRLVEIQGLSEVESLQYLHISSCGLIAGLPNLSKLNKLQHVDLEDCPNLRAMRELLDVTRTTWLCHKIPSYDVFLSFKEQDIGHGFVDALYNGLVDCRISVCRDDHELSFDDGIDEQMEQAIEASPICITIFSLNYASSQGCLRALAHMVKCMSKWKSQKRILPIFYDVESYDVELESKFYQNDLDKHRKNFPHDEVKAWEEALKKTACIRGFQVKKDEG
ncbi:hypothetical protein BT93_C1677 [Corymbia citriodora subsp. variegata]|nr:hypothetical protein BT93_C1677 [Corymbia citriodora subsp. variegata]